MEVLLFVVCCFLQLYSAFCLECMKCYSQNYRTCDTAMYKKSCRGNSNICYTLRYYNQLDDGKEQHGFKKGCVDERFGDCQDVCQRYTDIGYNECTVSCCEGDDCNKDGFMSLADQNNKMKRSSIENNNNGNNNDDNNDIANSSNQYHRKLTFITLCALSLPLYFFLT